MRLSKTLLVLAAFCAFSATAAEAGDWTSSSNYNGYGASSQNTPSSYSMRDANGNLTMVNGQIEPSSYSSTSGVQSANAGGVGMSGATSTTGTATAIGNSLNVVVVGSHNTTILDTTQVNTGNQTATTALNH